MKYFTIIEFNKKYPTEEACLRELFDAQYKKIKQCRGCKRETVFYKLKKRRCYACKWCKYQVYPTAGTIFHGSKTSLLKWFYAIYKFANSKNGVSAKELQRDLGVTYKCAFRMGKQIRVLFKKEEKKLKGVVEIDEAYMGYRRKRWKQTKDKPKVPVIGLVERSGAVKAIVVENAKANVVLPIIKEHVRSDSIIMTDESLIYFTLKRKGYEHHTINHGGFQWARGAVHTNTIEGFWSGLKVSISGTFRGVSKKYLQSYVDYFSFVYNQRNVSLFPLLVSKASQPIELDS